MDQSGSETDSDPSLVLPRSTSKFTGEKRSGAEIVERSEHAAKRVKMRDLESVFRSEGIDTHCPNPSKKKEVGNPFCFGKEDMSQITVEPEIIVLDDIQEERTAKETLPLFGDRSHKPLDLNTKVPIANNSACGSIPSDAGHSNKRLLQRQHGREHDVKTVTSRGADFDLNVEDVSTSVSQNHFHPYKKHDHSKSRDVSECASSTGPVEVKDPLTVWKEMKQNGFLSSSHGGIPVPKPRPKKSKNESLKKKMEIAKKEQVDRFTKIAAPSGLLNDLNPGIINHVRNSKQVHSIIEALVRSERLENGHSGSKQASQLKIGSKEIGDRKKDQETIIDSGPNRLILPHEVGRRHTLPENRQTRGFPMSLNKCTSLSSEVNGRDAHSSMVDRMVCGRTSCDPHPTSNNENDILALKVSSSITNASENVSSLSNEDNLTSVSSLSVRAATIASQWLELLHQDIKGRLAALRRSKKRVRAVIQTELPLLLSKEFPSDQENDPFVTENAAAGCPNNAIAAMHRARWSALFHQMDQVLSEEEKQLESWSNQVREMHLHCEKSLHHGNAIPWMQQQGISERISENDLRSEIVDKPERELAIRAAAASIYSTCNFLLSMQNVSCF